MYRIKYLAIASLVGSLAVYTIGCGGGASTEPEITVKPAETSNGGTIVDDDDPGQAVEGYGTLTGVITFDGNPPDLAPLVEKGQAVKDAEVCSAEPVPNQTLVVDSATKGIANVFIYLDRAPQGAKVPEVPEEPVVFDQKGCAFIPHAMVVRVDQPLKILSDDPIAHNTNTKPLANQKQNFLLKPKDRDGVTITYSRSEKQPFQVVCDIHPWMLAYHMTLDHPYMAVTAEDGTFEIKDVPAGEHTFRVWHETGKFLERSAKVTIKPAPEESEPLKLRFGPEKFAQADGPPVKRVVLSLK